MQLKKFFLGAMMMAAATSQVVSSPAYAHHSFAMFDQTRTMQANVVVSRIEWTNPHAYLFFTLAGKSGNDARVAVECGSINLLARKGWKFSSLRVGETVTLAYHPFKNGRQGGMLVSVTKKDGTTLKG
jgi:hypothetical protein